MVGFQGTGLPNFSAPSGSSAQGFPAQKPESLQLLYDGPRPAGYEVMHKGGAIVLGIGGDNSPWGAGVFYEGAITAGYAGQATDEAVAANVVSAGYRV